MHGTGIVGNHEKNKYEGHKVCIQRERETALARERARAGEAASEVGGESESVNQDLRFSFFIKRSTETLSIYTACASTKISHLR